MNSNTDITLQSIGVVETEIADGDVPSRRREMISNIVINKDLEEALEGIENYSHLFVLFWMDQVDRNEFRTKVHPRGRKEFPLTGILATRGRNHPNPVGLAVVELLERTGNRLRVKKLDAFNGTPIIDIKPYDDYDRIEDVKVPDWWPGRKKKPSN